MNQKRLSFGLWAVLLAIGLAMMLPIASAQAATADLKPCFRPAKSGETISEIIQCPESFACQSRQNALPAGDYWVRLDVPATFESAGKAPIFRTASLWDDGIELWVMRSDGALSYYDPMHSQSLNPMRLGATMVVPLHTAELPIKTIYAKIHNTAAMRGVVNQPQIVHGEDALRFEMTLAVMYALFAGICIALLVYNIALWQGMRAPFLIAYCAMLLATLTYGFFTSGAPHYFIPELTGPDRLRLTIALLGINAGTALIFIRHFFEASNVPQWLVRLTYFQTASVIGFSLLYALCAPAYLAFFDTVFVCNFVPLPIIALIYVVNAYKRRDPFFWYFLAAWAGPGVGVIVRILSGLNILPYNIIIENSTLIGLSCEAMISSLAIGQRIRSVMRDRDQAIAAERVANDLADKDSLTGLLNRRAFVRELLDAPREWQLVLIDIDHFKRVNDTLGHVGGDEALVKIAAVLEAKSPEGAMVARLGGEEFAIATRAPFDETGPADVTALLDAVRQTDMQGGYRITASIGVAQRVICEETDWKILYRAADMALYRAKAEGRDRFVDYSAERIAA